MELRIWDLSYLVSQSRREVSTWLAWQRRNIIPTSHPTEVRASKDLKRYAHNQMLALRLLSSEGPTPDTTPVTVIGRTRRQVLPHRDPSY